MPDCLSLDPTVEETQFFSLSNFLNFQQSRWALVCVLCRERVGACIQCSVKTCKTAYHVTCAFKNGLEMRAIIEDEMADDGVKLRVSFSVAAISAPSQFSLSVVLSKAQ